MVVVIILHRHIQLVILRVERHEQLQLFSSERLHCPTYSCLHQYSCFLLWGFRRSCLNQALLQLADGAVHLTYGCAFTRPCDRTGVLFLGYDYC